MKLEDGEKLKCEKKGHPLMGNCGEAGEIHLLFAHCPEWRMEVCQ